MLETVAGRKSDGKMGLDGVLISGAKVTRPDINASNVVVHSIDAVLMPK